MALANAFNGAINDVFRQSIRSWKKVIQHYVLENTDFLIRLMPEIEFVTKATELLLKLKAKGCPLCHPEIRPIADKAFTAKGLCNPIVSMKLDGPVIPNDFSFDRDGMIYVITGPNRGGKSVITCAVGIAFVMAQLGLPVCAEECIISPCDEVFTHFPTGSEDTIDKGRLGEECSRLSVIFEEVTEDSLVLLDEALSSTGSYEGAYIASEVLQGFSMVKCRGIFTTHLHDLAASVDRINETCQPKGGVKIDNLVAAIQEGSRSFKIRRAKPDGKSYARDIAEKYGLSIDKIMDKIKK
jgi:DNA mismatch repair ATPase MutS